MGIDKRIFCGLLILTTRHILVESLPVRELSEVSWTEWTECQYGIKVRERMCNPSEECTGDKKQTAKCETPEVVSGSKVPPSVYIYVPSLLVVLSACVAMCAFCLKKKQHRISRVEPEQPVILKPSSLPDSIDSSIASSASYASEESSYSEDEHDWMKLELMNRKLKILLARANRSLNEFNIKLALSNYRYFVKVADGSVELDDALVKETNALLKLCEQASKLKTERLRKDSIDVLKRANESLQKSQIKKAIKNHQDVVDVAGFPALNDQEVLQESEQILSDIDRREKLMDEHEKIRERLSNVLTCGTPIDVRLALNAYINFCGEHDIAEFIQIDSLLMDACKNVVLQAEVKKQDIIAHHDKLKDNLRIANTSQQVSEIETVMASYRQFVSDMGDEVAVDEALLKESQRVINVVYMKEKLSKAMGLVKLNALEDVMREIEIKRFEIWMMDDMTRARKLVRGLKRIKTLKHAIMHLDRASITELRDYDRPPQTIHDVITAALLILGDSEAVTSDWSNCRQLCSTVWSHGYPGIIKRLKDFDLNILHPEIAARGLEILEKYTETDVKGLSQCASFMHEWASAVCEERLAHLSERPVAACGKRQNELLAETLQVMKLTETSKIKRYTRKGKTGKKRRKHRSRVSGSEQSGTDTSRSMFMSSDDECVLVNEVFD